MASIELTLRIAKAMAAVAAGEWDACANPILSTHGTELSTLENEYNPFTSHDFLSSLELSDSVRPRAGWEPMHLLAEDKNGRLLGAVPCYAKSHSRGEYVFDHGWAEAFERAGGQYYPKMQISEPFKTATGRRLLVRPDPQAAAVQAPLADAVVEACSRSDDS